MRKKKEGGASPAPTDDRSGFLGLAAEECGDVEIVRGDFVGGLSDVLLDLMDNVGQRLLLRDGSFDFAPGFPGLGEELRLLLDVLFVGFLEAGGDDRDFHGVFHGIVHDGAENDVGVFMRGFLNDGRRLVDFVQGET